MLASSGVGFCFSGIHLFLKVCDSAQSRIAHAFALRLYTGERLVGRVCIRKNLCELCATRYGTRAFRATFPLGTRR
jgi:hypothetical protein